MGDVPRIPRGRSHSSLPHRSPWFTRPGIRERIERDAEIVVSAYSGLALRLDEKAGTACLEGTLVHREAESAIPTPIALRIVLRDGYPRKEPLAYETAELFEHGNLDGHVLREGRLCLWLPTRSQWRGRDPEHSWSWQDRDALLRFVDQVLVFAERHLIWQVTRVWPGGESAHGSEGYIEYVHEILSCPVEQLLEFAVAFGESDGIDPYTTCPCGSGKKYRFCHREQVRALRRECGCIGPAAFEAYGSRASP